MSKDLLERNSEKGYSCDDAWVKIAFKEILHNIYNNAMTETAWDEIVNKVANLIISKTNLSEEDLNWQKIEEEISKDSYELLYYLNFDEVLEIIYVSKVSGEYDWEDISSKKFPIEDINKKILNSIKENIDFMEKEELENFYRESV